MKKTGWTLIELMIVMVIVAIGLAIAAKGCSTEANVPVVSIEDPVLRQFDRATTELGLKRVDVLCLGGYQFVMPKYGESRNTPIQILSDTGKGVPCTETNQSRAAIPGR